MEMIAPCGYDDYCCNCLGIGICPWTKTDDTVLTDAERIINNHMIQALKDTMGIDIVKIKELFERQEE